MNCRTCACIVTAARIRAMTTLTRRLVLMAGVMLSSMSVSFAHAEPPATSGDASNASSSSAAVVDSQRPQKEAAFIAESEAQLAEFNQAAQNAQAQRVEDLVRLTIRDGVFKLDLQPAAPSEGSGVPLKGVEGYLIVDRVDPIYGPNARLFVLDRAAKRTTHVQLLSGPFQFGFSVDVNTPTMATSAQFQTRSPDMADENGESAASLLVQMFPDDTDLSVDGSDRLSVFAPDAASLIEQNHDLVLASCGPGLEAIHAMHLLAGKSDRQVRQIVASTLQVAPELQARVEQIVKEMAAAPESGESKLNAVLDQHGLSASMALARVSRDGWSADMTMRIDSALAKFLPDDPGQTEKQLTNPTLFIDLLYWPDESVRRAVLTHLQTLRKLPVEIDPAADPYEQARKIESLRAVLAPDK